MGQDAIKSRYKQRQEEARRETIMRKIEESSKNATKTEEAFEESRLNEDKEVSRSMVQREF